MKRETYSKEFKIKAVELSDVRGNVQEIARELGVGADLIYRWRRDIQNKPSLAFGGRGIKQLTEEQRELERITKELADVTMERDILKKAVAESLLKKSKPNSFIKTTMKVKNTQQSQYFNG